MQQSNSPRSRILAIGILLIVMLLFVMLLVNPYIRVLNASEDYADDRAFQLQRGNKMLRKRNFIWMNLISWRIHLVQKTFT